VPADVAEVPPERIDADQVTLRRIEAADAGAVAAAVGASLEHLRPWMPWATPEAADLRTQLVRAAEADQRWNEGTGFTYAVLTTAQGTFVGEIALHRLTAEDSAEIGYWIASGQVGRGYATAAGRAMTAAALALPGVNWVEIHCDAANAPSAAVARRLGFRLDRIETRQREAPGESGQLLVWIRDQPYED
jgi:RimJ/RimL family protein N-acetyltransferase